MFYDLLHSPDAVVADVHETARTLVERVGLPEPRPGWFQQSVCHGYEALFARVHPSRQHAPSRIEAIAPGPQSSSPAGTDIPAYVREIAALQGDRPLKTHATVLTSSLFPEIVDELRRKAVRHRVDPPSRDLGHERLWVGFSPDGGPRYSPDDDAGIFFEVIPTQCLGLPESAAGSVPADRPDVAPGQMIRVAARSYLVDRLDPVLATLEERLCWPVARVDGASGERRAEMSVNFPASARFELVEPGHDPDAAAHFGRWGPGTYATRITVRGLDAKADDLRERGTPFRILPAQAARPETIRVALSAVPGFLFDFVDDDDELTR